MLDSVGSASQPGKEILYPVATVILGGLISSTLLDFFVHPALFWLYGRKEAERVVHAAQEAVDRFPGVLLYKPNRAHALLFLGRARDRPAT